MRLSACYVVKKMAALTISEFTYNLQDSDSLLKLHVSVRSRHVWRRQMKDLVSGTLTAHTEYNKFMPSCRPLVSPPLRVSSRDHCRYT